MRHAPRPPAPTLLLGPAEELTPWKPGPGDPWDLAKAAHLLRRAGFGARPEEQEAVLAIGPDRTIDALLTPAAHPVATHGTRILPGGELLNLGTLAGQQALLLHTQATTPWLLQEKLTAFWLDHFSVGLESSVYAETMGAHAATLRAFALAPFKSILSAVTKDPAMLRWLDNYLSTAKAPNENYARELMELYTMGVSGGYTEQDIKEASRALSGHTLDGANTYRFNDSTTGHDYGAKTVLGKPISNPHPNGAADLDDLLDILLAHPATARFMVRKIWEWFVSPAPDPALIDHLAGLWAGGGFGVRSLMGLILRSRAFFSSTAYRTLVKDPLDFSVGLVRLLDAQVAYAGMASRVAAQGYALLNFANPSGLDDGAAWLTSQALIERANFAQALVQQGGSTNLRATVDLNREIRRAGLKTAAEVVDHYLKFMVDGLAPAAVRSSLIHYMDNVDSGPRPFDVNNPTHVKEKVSGLIHLIAALPEFQMK